MIGAGLRLAGADAHVPCLDGGERRYVNLDSAASTPALVEVRDAVEAMIPWYSSVHRGAGYKSRVSTAAYEGARRAVAEFCGCGDAHEVIFTRNTTEAINLLAASLPQGSAVLVTPNEHHANLLPWLERHEATVLPFTSGPDELLDAVRAALRARPTRLLAVSGASNVTGDVWPAAELVALAHEHEAEIFIDAAQLAPHRAVSIRDLDADFLALSGHKLYAPYGAGALVARTCSLRDGRPLLLGGGAVKVVTLEGVAFSGLPDRFEAGSPNVIGAVALGVACDTLQRFGLDKLEALEQPVADELRRGVGAVDGVEVLQAWPDHDDRLGVVTFRFDPLDHGLVAVALADEWGVAVRAGSFCAHPLVAHLLGVDPADVDRRLRGARSGQAMHMPGALRASIGLGVSRADVELFLHALESIAAGGPAHEYAWHERSREWRPIDDRRPRPRLPFRQAHDTRPPATGCL